MRKGWEVVETKSCVIPSLPPSMNKLYDIIPIWTQRRIEVRMRPDVARWKSAVKEYIPIMSPLKDSFMFRVGFVFEYDHFYKNGKFKQVDTQNLMKALIDAIAEKQGMSDAVFKFGSWESYHSKDEKVEVMIEQLFEKTVLNV